VILVRTTSTSLFIYFLHVTLMAATPSNFRHKKKTYFHSPENCIISLWGSQGVSSFNLHMKIYENLYTLKTLPILNTLIFFFGEILFPLSFNILSFFY